jgi:hypothetical protein
MELYVNQLSDIYYEEDFDFKKKIDKPINFSRFMSKSVVIFLCQIKFIMLKVD